MANGREYFREESSIRRVLLRAQRTQLTWSLYEAFGAFEFMFYASKSDAIPDEVWKRWSEATAWWLTFPGVRAWWNARPVPFTESFTTFVDSLIRDNPTDAQAMKRWREFMVLQTAAPDQPAHWPAPLCSVPASARLRYAAECASQACPLRRPPASPGSRSPPRRPPRGPRMAQFLIVRWSARRSTLFGRARPGSSRSTRRG